MNTFFKTYVLLFCVLLSASSFSQDLVSIQDLYLELGNLAANDTNRVKVYHDLAWEYRKTSPDSTIFYSNKAIGLINKLELKSGKAKSFNYIGVAYNYKGENLKAYENYKKALEQGKNDKDVVQHAHALNSLGRLYLSQGDFLDSYNSYLEAEKLFESVNDQDGLSYTYKSLAELYQSQNEFSKALDMAQKAYDIRVNTDNIRGQISALTEIAMIYKYMGDFEQSFEYFLKAKTQAESINDAINIANIDLGTSILYSNEDRFDEALIYGLKALRTAKKTDNVELSGQIELQLGKVYFGLNEENKALYYLQKVVADTKSEEEIQVLRDAYYFIYQIANNQKQTSKSLEAYLKYSELDREWNNAQEARSIQQLEAKNEIAAKTKENAILTAQQALDEAVIESQRIQNWALVGIVILVSIIMVVVSVFSRKRKVANLRLKEQNEEILAQREEISRQNSFISDQNETLQKRNSDLDQLNSEKDTLMNIVAHDLKSPFNRIKGISELLKLSGLNEEQKNYNQLLRDITQSGINLIRDLLDVNSFEVDSRKMTISELSINDFLLEKANQFYSEAKKKNIEIITNIKNDKGSVILFSDKIYISRILDNLISNAIKFSNANSKVSIGAIKVDGRIEIYVQDEGQGFDREDKKNLYKKFNQLSARPTSGESSNGLGLAIVKTLMDRLGGQIQLDSTIGKGSKFTLVFPVGNLVSELKAEA